MDPVGRPQRRRRVVGSVTEPQKAMVVRGVGAYVAIGLYDVTDPDNPIITDGVKVLPEDARLIASKLTWESMEVENGNR